jgi:3-hydroxyacyl-[acyl-carrier-protein] dehydratase
MTLDINAIQALIPHRYPFLLIDRMEDIHLGESAVGMKSVSFNEWFFQGHFPGHPVMPGVLIVEAMAQTAAALVVQTLNTEGKKVTGGADSVVYFMSIDEAKFRKPVVPGDMLKLHVTKDRCRGNIWRFRGEANVQGNLVAQAIFTAMIVDNE